jgi:uncharacterized protein YwbE
LGSWAIILSFKPGLKVKSTLIQDIKKYSLLEEIIIGSVASVLTHSSSVPQVIKNFRTKQMDDISTLFLTQLTIPILKKPRLPSITPVAPQNKIFKNSKRVILLSNI